MDRKEAKMLGFNVSEVYGPWDVKGGLIDVYISKIVTTYFCN